MAARHLTRERRLATMIDYEGALPEDEGHVDCDGEVDSDLPREPADCPAFECIEPGDCAVRGRCALVEDDELDSWL